MNIVDYINSPLPILRELDFFFQRSNPLTILDIGACEGEDSVRYKKIFQRAKIYSFEPLPQNLLKIKANFATYSLEHEIEVVPVALSDSNGVAKFHVSSGTPFGIESNSSWDYGNKSSSLLTPATELKKNYPWLKFDNQIEVPTQRIDSFCEENGIDQIDFVHMDVQGAELKVLKGAGRLLSNIKSIWLEVENIELYSSQPLKKEIELFMKTHGFLKLIDTVNQISGDQFYCNKKYFSSTKFVGYRLLKVSDKIKRKMMTLFKQYFD